MKKSVLIILFVIAVIVVLVICVSAGQSFIAPWKVISAASDDGIRVIFFNLRLPRVLTAFAVGAALAVSGALFQSLLKNPLADPYTIGVSGGASLGAAAAIIAGLSYPLIAGSSLAGGIMIALAVSAMARMRNASPSSVILAGVSLSLILSSGVTLLFALGESRSVHKALLWLMGDFSLARVTFLVPTAAGMGLLALFALVYAPHLNLLTYGAAYAKSAGVSRRDAMVIFWIASSLTALAVSLCGVVAFAGLVIPHLARRVTGADHRALLPVCTLGGGAFLALCDTIGRTLAYPYEVPSGVVTGIVGGVFLLVMIMRRR
jgi:iron complex transport system permease protein